MHSVLASRHAATCHFFCSDPLHQRMLGVRIEEFNLVGPTSKHYGPDELLPADRIIREERPALIIYFLDKG